MRDLNPEDLVISRYKEGGKKSETGIEVVHIPTGIRVRNNSTDNAFRNRNFAMSELTRRLENNPYTDKERLDFLIETQYHITSVSNSEYMLYNPNGASGVDCTLYGVSSHDPRDVIDAVMKIEQGGV